jgi:hypothetical protein
VHNTDAWAIANLNLRSSARLAKQPARVIAACNVSGKLRDVSGRSRNDRENRRAFSDSLETLEVVYLSMPSGSRGGVERCAGPPPAKT